MDATIPNGHAGDLATETGATGDSIWSYYGNTDYEGNFAADIDAIAHEASSSVGSNTSTFTNSCYNSVRPRGNSSGGGSVAGSVCPSTASLTVNWGSLDDLPTTRPNAKHDGRISSPRFESTESGPTPLELWLGTEERHDLISYQGVQPLMKKRKSSRGCSGRSNRKSRDGQEKPSRET